MMPPVLIIVSLVAFTAFMLAACVALAFAVRGRAVACPPCCAGCGHAVGDLVVAAGSRCAECGRALDGVDDIRYFRRSLRVRTFVYAGLLVAMGFGVSFGIAFLRSTLGPGGRVGSQTTSELATAVRTNGSNAWTEINALSSRAKSLSDAELTSVVDAFRAAKDGGILFFLSPEGADVVGEARRRNLIDDATVIELAYAGQEELRLDVPDDVRAGAKHQVSRGRQAMGGIGGNVSVSLTTATVGGTPLTLEDLYPNFATVRFDVAPGEYDVETTFASNATLRGTAGTFPPATATLTRKQRVRVHAADAPTWIGTEVNPNLAPAVRATIRASVVALDRQADGRTAIRVDLALRPTHVIPVSFECSVEIGGVRHALGPRWAFMRGSSSSYMSGTLAVSADVQADDATTATLILTPSTSAIEQQRGVDRIWGGEFRLPLKVVREREAAALPSSPMGGSR